MIDHLLTETELEILDPSSETPLAVMWHECYLREHDNWIYKRHTLAKAIWGWSGAFPLYYFSRWTKALLFVHWIMSLNNGFPMVIDKMTDDYSGWFECTKIPACFYLLFQDPYYKSWILMLFDDSRTFLDSVFTVYQISHGEDAIMFLSPEED